MTDAALNRIFIDNDGGACLEPSGSDNNLVAIPAHDDDGNLLNPNAWLRMVEAYNNSLSPAAVTVKPLIDSSDVSETSSKVVEEIAYNHVEIANSPTGVMGDAYHLRTSQVLRSLLAERDILKSELKGTREGAQIIAEWLKQAHSLTPAPVAPAAVTVKPLEWDDNRAQAIIGSYTYGVIGQSWEVHLNGVIVSHGEEATFCDAMKAAKAATQADYERRILSALTPAPVAGWRDFHEWWSADGNAIDPEPDVSWYDKRRDFAEMAFNAARLLSSAPGEQPDAVQEAARESIIDELEEIISETHEIDVTDRRYAENIVGWLELHHPAALRALSEGKG